MQYFVLMFVVTISMAGPIPIHREREREGERERERERGREREGVLNLVILVWTTVQLNLAPKSLQFQYTRKDNCFILFSPVGINQA